MLEVIQNLLVRESPVKWLFTGDSITAGALHTFGWRDYVELFTERVRFELSRSRDVVIKTAVNGWTIGRIWDDLDRNVLQFQPDCVSVMVGLNDCKAGAAGVYDFREIYLRTIDRIRDETGAAVVLHTPNWLLATDLSERLLYLPAYAEAVRVICRTAGVPCVDHFTDWQGAEASGAMHSWIGHGCHPNEYGHRVLAFALFRLLGIWDANSLTCRMLVQWP